MMSSSRILLLSNAPATPPALESALEAWSASSQAHHATPALRDFLTREFAPIPLYADTAFADSPDLARLVRRHPRAQETPIIFLAAPGLNGFALEEAYAPNAVDHPAEPLNAAVLRAKIRFFIDLQHKGAGFSRRRTEGSEAALQTRDRRLRVILDNTHDYALVVTSPDGRIVERDGAAQPLQAGMRMKPSRETFLCSSRPNTRQSTGRKPSGAAHGKPGAQPTSAGIMQGRQLLVR